nr:unnamed protein product [Callosobruchus chinensis]
MKLKNNKGTDVYGLNVKILKTVANLIIASLTKLFNLCIKNKIFPDILKIAKVISIFKEGNVNELSYFRPISLVTMLAKVFEILLKEQINESFLRNELFTSCQLCVEK